MKEFKDFINELNTDKPIDCIITFFIDNEWFGETIRKKNGKIILSDEQIELFTDKLTPFLGNKDVSIYEYFKEKFPETYKLYNIFQSETQVDEETTHYIVDFMLYRLNKELFFYSDNEMEELLSNATFELIKAHGDIFTFFIAWLKLNHKTAYQKDYVLNKRYTMDIQNEAYDFDDYICLLYYLFSEDYIENNEMFRKAAESKNYTDTWLYLALHFIRPLRMTDMKRIYHPILPYSSEEVIEKIKNDEFSDNDARYVLLSITKRMNWLPLTPNKTASSSDVIPISFDIPTSCETLIGKLFALAQAHRNQAGTPDAPIVRKVSTYQEINRYMGEEIGGLFLNNDFRSRSATKSFLQDIYMVADENIPADDSGYHVKGYYLAAYVRSHKGSYGHIAATTFEYLKDAKFNKLTPEFVAFELLERGVFFYYPLYIWWILTAVIPLRPREFLLTERDCIYKNSDGRYHLKLRRNLLKGGAGGELSYKISDAYHTQPIPIPDYLGKIIENYIIETDKYEHTAIDTLFVTDPHYRKWGQHKHSDSRFLTYMNMNTILKYFFKEIVHEKYGYTIVYDNGEVNHENKEIRYIHLGDTRHIAFINLMQEGATPVTAMLLGGHTNIEMASHYYSNVIQFIECQTYRQYRKCICGDVEYKLSHADNLPPADEFKLLSDGGICYSSQYQNGSISDCINVSGPNGEIGYCPECVYYRKQGTSYFSSDDIYKRHIEEDSKTLFLAVQSVMEGKGNTENINEAILKLNSSNYSYKAYLLEKYVHEGENNG